MDAVNKAMVFIAEKDWKGARRVVKPAGQVGYDIVDWHRLRGLNGDFNEYIEFLDRRADWPGLPLMRKSGESKIPRDAKPAKVLAYFADQEPRTGTGAIRLAAALKATGEQNKSEAELIRAWRTMPMSEGVEKAYLARHSAVLTPHHNARMDMLLWTDQTTNAKRMLQIVSGGHRTLAKARLGLKAKSKGVDGLIAAVPKSLQGDPGLAHDRFVWRAKKKGRTADAMALMLEKSTSAEALGRPEKWSGRRRTYARQTMRNGEAKTAYRLASQHYLTEGDDFIDLEWLAGFIALTDLNDPKTALKHFKRFRAAVSSPISLGRAGYWEGRAHEAVGDAESARAAYAFGAEFQTSFYGLLAAEKVDVPMNSNLTGREEFPDFADTPHGGSSVLAAAMLFQKAGYPLLFTRFTRHLAEVLNREERGALAQIALDLDEPYAALYMAKYSARSGIVLMRSYYPITDVLSGKLPVPHELALSIARRESEFYPTVVSRAGARGLMQLMPRTAKAMAQKSGLKFNMTKLTADPAYNVTLGSAYLRELMDDTGSYYPFVAAGYNAGPSRPIKWAKIYGDPRRSTEAAVDWIEHIPFRETRNYVMRVMESLPVYRARLTGETAPLTLSQELTGG